MVDSENNHDESDHRSAKRVTVSSKTLEAEMKAHVPHPVHVRVLSEREDEQSHGKERSEPHGTPKAVLGNGNTVVLLLNLVVLLVGPETSSESDKATEDESEVRETSVAFGPAVVASEGERDLRAQKSGG